MSVPQYNTSVTLFTKDALCHSEPNVAYDVLQEVNIPVVGNKQCSCTYRQVSGVTITNNMMCAGVLGKGVCQVCVI